MNIIKMPPADNVREMSISSFFSVLFKRRKYLFYIIGLFALVSVAVSFSYKPGCSVSCVLAVGSLGDGRPVQTPEATVAETLNSFPTYASGKVFPGVAMEDSGLWTKTFFMAHAGPGLVRLSGRTYSASAARSLASAVSEYILARHKTIYDTERAVIKEQISEFNASVSAAAKIEAKGLARGADSPEIVLSRTFSGWAKTELVKLRRQEKTVGESRVFSGPSVSCTTRSFQLVFNLFLALLLGTLVALLVILWVENWKHTVTSIF